MTTAINSWGESKLFVRENVSPKYQSEAGREKKMLTRRRPFCVFKPARKTKARRYFSNLGNSVK